jgi:hypothetical protein
MVKKTPIANVAAEVKADAVIKEIAVATKPKRKPSVRSQPEASPSPIVAVSPASVNVVRDGFTMPQDEYDVLKALKAICLKEGVAVKKSELLRAGLKALTQMPTAKLLQTVSALPLIKSGRKKKS